MEIIIYLEHYYICRNNLNNVAVQSIKHLRFDGNITHIKKKNRNQKKILFFLGSRGQTIGQAT